MPAGAAGSRSAWRSPGFRTGRPGWWPSGWTGRWRACSIRRTAIPPGSSGSTCRSGCSNRAGARRTRWPAACSGPGAARSSRSRPGPSGPSSATRPRTSSAGSSPARVSARRRGGCGRSCSRPTGTARRASIRSTKCTRNSRSARWRAPRSATASTRPRAASCAVSCWPGPGSCSRPARPATSRAPGRPRRRTPWMRRPWPGAPGVSPPAARSSCLTGPSGTATAGRSRSAT
jgi:hypothetical protein